MTFTFTNGELVDILSKLEKALNMDIELPPKLSYRIVKNEITIKEALKPFEQMRGNIIKQKSGGNGSILYDDNPQLFSAVMSEINEISNEKVELNISEIELDDIPESGVPISFVSALAFMIKS